MSLQNKKTVWILRGTSGSGKNFVTDKLSRRIGWVSVSADDYFTDKEGNYNFDVTGLGNAHLQCKTRFLEALAESTVTDIIVNNTNTQEKEFNFYKEKAEQIGADVIFLVVEKRHEGENSHNVPIEAIDRHESRIRESLKLC